MVEHDSAARKKWLLVLLTAILIVNYADRLVFGVVLQDVKRDLALSDTHLGFLTGIAFALFYAVMGIPIARWADVGNRVSILAVCTTFWSGAVALCGAAAGFWQLLLLRIGVAAGEAGCYAPSLSLISDHFGRAERARAVARYMLGIPLAMIIGFLAAGWLNQLHGWRWTFVLFGLPGLLLGPLAWLTLKDPRQRLSPGLLQPKLDDATEQSGPRPSFPEVCVALWKNIPYRHLFFMFTIYGFFAQGILLWQPAFFMRTHGLGTGELGTWLAVVQGLGGALGTYVGGEAATRFASHNERLQLFAMATAYVMLTGLSAAIYSAATHEHAFLMLAIYSVVNGACAGPLFATIQTIVAPQMRASAVAIMYFFCNLVGLGLGPLCIGILSDALGPYVGDESLRYVLLLFCPGYLWCGWHLWRAGRSLTRDFAIQSDEALFPYRSRSEFHGSSD